METGNMNSFGRFSEQRLRDIETRCQLATQGPWLCNTNTLRKVGILPNDAEFIVHARMDVPDLLAEVVRLQEIVKRKHTANDCEFPPHIKALATAILDNDKVAVYALFDALKESSDLFTGMTNTFDEFTDEIGPRARRVLKLCGIMSFETLINKTADDLLEFKNFGRTSLQYVRVKLAKRGMKLKGD